MPPPVATLVYAILILVLFQLDQDRKARTSKALWIPVVWMWLSGSRMVSGWLTALGFAAPLWSADSPQSYVEGSPLDRLVFLGLTAAGFSVLVTRRRQVGAILRRNGPIVVFLCYCGLSALWSDYPDVTLKRWIKALGDFVMVLIVLTDADRLTAIKRMLSRIGFVLLPISILLIKYYGDLGRVFRHDTSGGDWVPIYIGVTPDKNDLGMITLIFGLGAVWRTADLLWSKDVPDRRRHMIAQGALLGVAIWLLLMVHSVTAAVCFLSASAVLAATSMPRLARRPAAVHFLVVGLLSTSLFVIFIAPALLPALGRDPTLTGRTKLWTDALALTPNALLGTGYESFWLGDRLEKMWSLYWWHPNEAHNGYLEVYLTLGWIGVALLAVIVVTGYRNAVAKFHRSPAIGRLALTYFVIALMYSFSEAAFRMLTPVWIFFLVATVAIPEPAVTEATLPLGIAHADGLAESEPQVDPVLRAESFPETL